MKILVVGDPHGKTKNIDKKVLENTDSVIITGDLGKADIARKKAFENVTRKKQGLEEKDYTPTESKKAYMEIYSSSIDVVKKYSKIAPAYSILGNVGDTIIQEKERKKEERKYGIKLPSLRKGLNSIKNFHLVKNKVRNIKGQRIGFLEYFVDKCWVKNFKPGDYKEKMAEAKEDTVKARKILKNFNGLDVLVCHQPPYGHLDKVTNPKAPKHWQGKHAGSKAILKYIKKHKPKYVFCGHIHESKGKSRIGKTQVYNLGWQGDYLILDTEKDEIIDSNFLE